MVSRTLSVVALAVASLGLCGCPLLWLGAGVAGGYAIGTDSVSNQFALSKEKLFRHSAVVARRMGMVTVEDDARGVIQLKVGEADVTITITPLTDKTVGLTVKARNPLLMPQVAVAQRVYNAIAQRLWYAH